MSLAKKTKSQPVSTARPDERGRITLGALTNGVSRYDVYIDEAGVVTLLPFKEIAASEAWLYGNSTAQKLVAEGLKAAREGRFSKTQFQPTSWIDEIEDEE